MATVLEIAGSVVDRGANRLILHELALSLDDDEQFTFTEIRVPGGPGSWSEGDSCRVTIDGTTYFIGQITSAHPTPAGAGCIDVTYTATGLRYLANNIFLTATDGAGQLSWNLSLDDPDYAPALAGTPLSDIIAEVLDLHDAELAAIGLDAIPPYDAAELAALEVVPNEPVMLAGRLMDNLADLVAQWAPKYAIYCDASDGRIHVKDTLTLPATTLTLDTDPITLDSVAKSHGECYTRVICRGAADVEAAFLSLGEGTLEAGWDEADQDIWTQADFYRPRDASDFGDITAMSSTTLTIQSDDAGVHVSANFWNSIGAWVYAYDPVATGITFTEDRRVTANTAMTAGGTCVLTLERPLANSGYTRYQLRGSRTALSLVWRKFNVIPTWVAEHLARRFQHSHPWAPVDGAVVQAEAPVGNVCYSDSGVGPPWNEVPQNFEVVPYDGTTPGHIIFHQPVCFVYETEANRNLGGSAVRPPGDVKVLVPYSRGALSVTRPTSSFEGTAYTADGVERTLYREIPQWLDAGDAPNMGLLAQEVLDSVKDTCIDGQITIYNKVLSWLSLGKALNVARWGGTTGWEALAAPVRRVSLHYQHHAAIWITRLAFSTRRRAFSGDRLYMPQPYAAGQSYAGFETFDPYASFRAGLSGQLAAGGDVAGAFGALGGAATGAFGAIGRAARQATTPAVTGADMGAMGGTAYAMMGGGGGGGAAAGGVPEYAMADIPERQRLTQQQQVARDEARGLAAGNRQADVDTRDTMRQAANLKRSEAMTRLKGSRPLPEDVFTTTTESEEDAARYGG